MKRHCTASRGHLFPGCLFDLVIWSLARYSSNFVPPAQPRQLFELQRLGTRPPLVARRSGVGCCDWCLLRRAIIYSFFIHSYEFFIYQT